MADGDAAPAFRGDVCLEAGGMFCASEKKEPTHKGHACLAKDAEYRYAA